MRHERRDCFAGNGPAVAATRLQAFQVRLQTLCRKYYCAPGPLNREHPEDRQFCALATATSRETIERACFIFLPFLGLFSFILSFLLFLSSFYSGDLILEEKRGTQGCKSKSKTRAWSCEATEERGWRSITGYWCTFTRILFVFFMDSICWDNFDYLSMYEESCVFAIFIYIVRILLRMENLPWINEVETKREFRRISLISKQFSVKHKKKLHI